MLLTPLFRKKQKHKLVIHPNPFVTGDIVRLKPEKAEAFPGLLDPELQYKVYATAPHAVGILPVRNAVMYVDYNAFERVNPDMKDGYEEYQEIMQSQDLYKGE